MGQVGEAPPQTVGWVTLTLELLQDGQVEQTVLGACCDMLSIQDGYESIGERAVGVSFFSERSWKEIKVALTAFYPLLLTSEFLSSQSTRTRRSSHEIWRQRWD